MSTRYVLTLALVAAGLVLLPGAAAEGTRPEPPAAPPDEPAGARTESVNMGNELSGPPDPGSSCRPYC